MSTTQPLAKGKLDRSGINRIFQVVALTLIYSLLLFGGSGHLDWWQAWLFTAIYLGGILFNALWTLRRNPDLINERGKIAENSKAWDKVLMLIYTVLLVVTFVVAGLDRRFEWSTVSLALNLIGAIGLVVGMAIIDWAMSANRFLASMVRIQEERGHTTVTGGPYRFVRHPMYAGLFFFFWATPLLLGSWWALVPSALNVILFIVRTRLEDQTLQAELPGYLEYTRQVKYRLVPGVW